VDALKNIAIQTPNPVLRQVMTDVASEVETGARLSDAFERHPKTFGTFFVNMIRSGETSGQLQQVLEYLADQQEKDYDLTSRIRGAFTYPAFVLTALAIVGFLMVTFVVPSLTTILEESGQELPFSTRALVFVSSFFQHYWVLIIIGVILLVIGVQFFIRTPYGRELFDTLKLRLPIFGRLFQDIYVVRFSRSLGTLISGGVDQVTALEIVAGIVGNQVWRRLIFDTIREVNEGNSITTAFLRSRYVPTLMNQMLAVGEETGRLQEVLDRISDFFKREVDNLVRNLVTLIEPLVMVVLGLAVGVMVSAIMIPLYNMSSGV
jgi:type II secretory pathway component PulF